MLVTQETWAWPLGQEDPQEEEMAPRSSILAREIPWTEEPGGLQSMGSQWVGHNWAHARARAHPQRNINGTFFSPMYRSQNVQDWKRSVFIPIPKKGKAKECSNYSTIALISHTSKVMLNILQARLQQYMSCELPDVQAGFRKGRGTRHEIANIHWIIEKAREFQKNIYFCFIDYVKAFDWGSQQTVENSSRDGNTRPSDLPLEKSVCRSGSNS